MGEPDTRSSNERQQAGFEEVTETCDKHEIGTSDGTRRMQGKRQDREAGAPAPDCCAAVSSAHGRLQPLACAETQTQIHT